MPKTQDRLPLRFWGKLDHWMILLMVFFVSRSIPVDPGTRLIKFVVFACNIQKVFEVLV